MSGPKNSTKVVANWYRDADEFSSLINYRVLRAGHIQANAHFHIQRQAVVGHELIFCLKGSGKVRLEDKIWEVNAGNLVWLPVRWPHEHYANTADPWEILWIRIDGIKLNNIMTIMDILQCPVFHFHSPEKIVEIFHHIFELMDSHSLVAFAKCDLLCSTLIFNLLENRSFETAPLALIKHRGLGQLLFHIHSHYNDKWDIEKFMYYCKASKSQLFRMFHDTFKLSPMRWLKNYRLSQARRMLSETDDNIGRIAFLIGYNDPLHFSRDFHRATGVSPSEFRKQEHSEMIKNSPYPE